MRFYTLICLLFVPLTALAGNVGVFQSGGGGTTSYQSFPLQINDMTADGTECQDPTEAIINSGPKTHIIHCNMTGSETNGILYGDWITPDNYDGSPIGLELVIHMVTDSGAGTLYTEAFIMCRPDGSSINATWGDSVSLNFVLADGDAVNDTFLVHTAGIPGNGCVANVHQTVFWKIEICDTDATPDGNCTSSAGKENDFNFIGAKIEHGVTP